MVTEYNIISIYFENELSVTTILYLHLESKKNVGGTGSQRLKIVAVGDGAVGKTSLLISYITGDFPPTYVPTVFENHTKPVKREKDGSEVLLHLWDTAGQEDYDRLRPLSYPGADLILLCFSVSGDSSFQSIREKWHPEVSHYVSNVPKILVGTKVDLRDENSDPEGVFISTDQGKSMCEKIGAEEYIEVSSKTKYNLEKVFQRSIDHVLDMREQLEAKSPKIKAGTGSENDPDDANSSTKNKKNIRNNQANDVNDSDTKNNDINSSSTKKSKRDKCVII